MLKPIDTAQTVEWSHPDDRGDQATVFLLRPITKRYRALLINEAMTGQRSGTVNRGFVKAGLAGVRNFPGWATEKGPAEMGRDLDVPTDAFLDTLPDEVFDALSGRIAELSKLTEADAGKSSPPST